LFFLQVADASGQAPLVLRLAKANQTAKRPLRLTFERAVPRDAPDPVAEEALSEAEDFAWATDAGQEQDTGLQPLVRGDYVKWKGADKATTKK